jgi:hypothetical protein
MSGFARPTFPCLIKGLIGTLEKPCLLRVRQAPTTQGKFNPRSVNGILQFVSGLSVDA